MARGRARGGRRGDAARRLRQPRERGAITFLAAGDQRQAAAEFQKAMDLLPDDPAYLNNLAWVLATNVYLKTAQGWRLVAHHASPAGDLAEPASGEAPSTLH